MMTDSSQLIERKYSFCSKDLESDNYLSGVENISEDTILDCISNAGVMDYITTTGKVVEFRDGCNDFYSITLNKSHLLALSKELKELAENLPD
jgi:hypothetical protein